jgi:hypothetical protein
MFFVVCHLSESPHTAGMRRSLKMIAVKLKGVVYARIILKLMLKEMRYGDVNLYIRAGWHTLVKATMKLRSLQKTGGILN